MQLFSTPISETSRNSNIKNSKLQHSEWHSITCSVSAKVHVQKLFIENHPTVIFVDRIPSNYLLEVINYKSISFPRMETTHSFTRWNAMRFPLSVWKVITTSNDLQNCISIYRRSRMAAVPGIKRTVLPGNWHLFAESRYEYTQCTAHHMCVLVENVSQIRNRRIIVNCMQLRLLSFPQPC